MVKHAVHIVATVLQRVKNVIFLWVKSSDVSKDR